MIKRIFFNKNKFKRLFLFSLSMLLTWLVPVVLVLLLGFGLSSLLQNISSNPLNIKNIYDGIFLTCWFGSPIICLIFWILTRQSESYNNISSFFVYPIALLIVSVIPLFIKYPFVRNTSSVKAVLANTKLYFIVFAVLLVIGWLVNLYLTKSALKKSNWWLFIVTLPYLLTSFLIYRRYVEVDGFFKLKHFKYETVAAMLRQLKIPDLRVMNPLWYETIALIILSLIILIGVVTGEIIWKKTKTWRKKAKKENKKN